uniref:Ig-like domain-containing protein n=1 Tax=Hucho hucho TaxID=62062 RepID=A0A4W5JZ72_9TELE
MIYYTYGAGKGQVEGRQRFVIRSESGRYRTAGRVVRTRETGRRERAGGGGGGGGVVVVVVIVVSSLFTPPADPSVRPTVSLLPPSYEQLSGGSATLACLLSGYSPQGAMVSWEVDGEEGKGGRYSHSSTLTLSKARLDKGEVYTCRVAHDGTSESAEFQRSPCSV